jgi:hypothetical protein
MVFRIHQSSSFEFFNRLLRLLRQAETFSPWAGGMRDKSVTYDFPKLGMEKTCPSSQCGEQVESLPGFRKKHAKPAPMRPCMELVLQIAISS